MYDILKIPELAYAHWCVACVDSREDDEKKIHDGWTLKIRLIR